MISYFMEFLLLNNDKLNFHEEYILVPDTIMPYETFVVIIENWTYKKPKIIYILDFLKGCVFCIANWWISNNVLKIQIILISDGEWISTNNPHLLMYFLE